MSDSFFLDLEFQAKDFSGEKLPAGEYEDCHFSSCNFSKAELSKYQFTQCTFESCDLSNAIINGTSFRDVHFKDCKMFGLSFDQCNNFLLSFIFERCLLNFSSFFKLRLRNQVFDRCKLIQVDLSDADLSAARFTGCDLEGAIFFNTRLEKADLSSAHGFNIDPEANIIIGALFSTENVQGLLTKYKIQITP